MTGLRLEIDLGKIADNARSLVDRAAARNISITGVTKAMLGLPELAHLMYGSGTGVVGDSRIENIERMRDAGIDGPMLLVRTPLPSQIDRVVRSGVTSTNTEVDVLAALATSARVAGRIHDVMLMVELGDLREGILPEDLNDTVRVVLGLPQLRLTGIGANLACRSGVVPSDRNMGELGALVESVESTFGTRIPTVSGGNSANLNWALDSHDTDRINNLRLGESIILGREPLQRRAIPGLHADAVTLIAEVIESKRKPSKPWGSLGQNAFGETTEPADEGEVWQTILAVGRQDTDPGDLRAPDDVEVLAASSDHLVTRTGVQMRPGDEIRFAPGYSALLRSMTSVFVSKDLCG